MVHMIREVYHLKYTKKVLKDNQLHELYIAMMLKTLGLSLIGIFVPIYLYQLGHSLETIALFYFALFGIRTVTDNFAAWLTGYFGPKHMMILSHIFLVITLSLLLTLETTNWPLLLIAFLDALATGFFFVSYHIEFSKLQTADRAGSQLGTMYKVGKFASAVGPLIGGAVATFASVQVVIVMALVLIMASAIPLGLSPEPVRKRQHVTWKGFPWRETKWDMISNMGLSFDQMACMLVWPLYISIYIFSENIYLSVGLITSVGLGLSVLGATWFGKVIDRGDGRKLLNLGILTGSASHLVRPLINTAGSVFAFNLVNDSFSTAIRMPYTKGMYIAASSYEGYRDAYISVIMTSSNLIRSSVFLLLYLLMQNNSDRLSMQLIFVVAGITVWLTMLNRYKGLR